MLLRRIAPLLLLCACSVESADETSGTSTAAVQGDKDWSDDYSETVLILQKDPTCSDITKCKVTVCSGTLLASRVVLTARHCVQQNVQSHFFCNSDDEYDAIGGFKPGSTAPASSLSVFTGERPDPVHSAGGVVEKVFSIDDQRCNHDIAFLVLDKASAIALPWNLLTNTFSQKRFPSLYDGDLQAVGDSAVAVGYGEISPGQFDGVPSRHVKKSRITAAGPSKPDSLAAGEFTLSPATLGGDSGGPSFIQSHGARRVVGVHSFTGSTTSVDVQPTRSDPAIKDMYCKAMRLAGEVDAQCGS